MDCFSDPSPILMIVNLCLHSQNKHSIPHIISIKRIYGLVIQVILNSNPS